MRYGVTLAIMGLIGGSMLLADDKDKPMPVPGIGPIGEVKAVASGFRFTEGPAVDAKGQIFFTDIPNNRIHAISLDGKCSVFMEDTNGCNGLMFNPQGQLIACQGGASKLIAIDPITKKVTMLADQFESKPFNSPNDLVIDQQGGIYFTDPSFRGPGKQPKEGVYYVRPDGQVTLVTNEHAKPNGVLLSMDEKTLYVLYSGKPAFVSYPIVAPGKIGPGTVHENVTQPGDGLTMDKKGNLYLTQPRLKAIHVLSPDGKTLGMINVPENPSNCVFGGPDMKTLYITAQTSVYAAPMNVEGHRFGMRSAR